MATSDLRPESETCNRETTLATYVMVQKLTALMNELHAGTWFYRVEHGTNPCIVIQQGSQATK